MVGENQANFRMQLPRRSEKAVVEATCCSLLHKVVPFSSHTTNFVPSISKCRENKPERRLKSLGVSEKRSYGYTKVWSKGFNGIMH